MACLRQCLAESLGVLLRLADLRVDLAGRGAIALRFGGRAKLRIHLGVLVGLAGDRDLQRLGRRHRRLRVEQIEMAERVLHFLRGGLFERAGGVLVTQARASLAK